MKFIQLTAMDGHPILINMAHVITIQLNNDRSGSLLEMADDFIGDLTVRELPDEIMAKL